MVKITRIGQGVKSKLTVSCPEVLSKSHFRLRELAIFRSLMDSEEFCTLLAITVADNFLRIDNGFKTLAISLCKL